jgi:hypothetical protein
MGYVVLAAAVFGVNLLPAFGPRTRAVLVFFRELATAPTGRPAGRLHR